MTILRPCVSALFVHIDAEETGEFVCTSSKSELHVYLQGGRIAWATDSAYPYMFSRHLLANTALTKEMYTEVLEACRRDRLPLGETLLAWGLLSIDEITAALRHQIIGALGALADSPLERTIFLDRKRQFASYDRRLTFDARELVASAPPRVERTASLPPTSLGAAEALGRFEAELPDAAWLELRERDVVVAGRSTDAERKITKQLLRHTLLDGAKIVALRGVSKTVLGVALPETNRTLWSALRPDVALAATYATLCRLGGIAQATPVAQPADAWSKPSAVRTIGDANRPGAMEIGSFLESALEFEAIVLVEDDAVVCGASREWIDADWIRNLVRRRAPALQLFSTEPPAMVTDFDEESRLKMMLTGEDQVLCFGAELPGLPKRSLWMVAGRHAAQGLGWAYLATLSRHVVSILKDGANPARRRSKPRLLRVAGA